MEQWSKGKARNRNRVWAVDEVVVRRKEISSKKESRLHRRMQPEWGMAVW